MQIQVVTKNLWNKILNKKVLDLDNDGKIESLRYEVEGVFSQFKRMHTKLDEVNTNLKEIVSDEISKKKLAEDRIERINKELKVNEKLQEKVKDFVL